MAWKDDVDSRLIITIGAVSGFLVIVLSIGLQAWFLSEEQAELTGKASTAVNYQLEDLRAQQEKNLHTYRWLGDDKKVAAVSIEQGMKMLVETGGKLPKP